MEVEARERQLNTREESWKSEHAQKLSELQLLQRRIKEESKHQVRGLRCGHTWMPIAIPLET